MHVIKVYVRHTNTPAVSFTENVLLTGLKPTHITSTSLNTSYTPQPGHRGQTKSALLLYAAGKNV